MGAILVTGAYGLVGHAVRVALEATGRDVVAIDLSSAAEPGFPITAADVRDVHGLHALVVRSGPFDAVIHCGALSGPMLARDDPYRLIEVNLVGTANLLEVARIHRIPRFVFCSSVGAYGHTPEGLTPVGEDVPLRPTTVYGATKAAGEALVQGYRVQHGVEGVCLRLAWVYGPRRTTACEIRDMILAARASQVFRRPSGGSSLRQFVHVDDVAAALIRACDAPCPPRLAYTISGGSILSLSAVAGIVADRLPGLSVDIGPQPDDDDRQAFFDIAAAERDLGYRPGVTLADGIAAYADWLSGSAGPIPPPPAAR